MIPNACQMLVLSLATAGVSITLSKSHFFGWAREWIAEKNGGLGYLAKCPYCTSHWVSFLLVSIYQPYLTSAWAPLDWLIASFAMVTLSSFWGGLIIKAYSGAQPVEEEEEEEDEE